MFYLGFRSSRQPGKQTNKLSGQIKQVFSLRVPALIYFILQVDDAFIKYAVQLSNAEAELNYSTVVLPHQKHNSQIEHVCI